VLAAVDARAAALGLAPGLTLADARARVPDLLGFPHDAAADAALLDWLAAGADRYTPMVMVGPQALLLKKLAVLTAGKPNYLKLVAIRLDDFDGLGSDGTGRPENDDATHETILPPK
jgi:protein ImuB